MSAGMNAEQLLTFRLMTENDHVNVLRFFRNQMPLKMKDHYVTVHLHVTGKAPRHALGEISAEDMRFLEVDFGRKSKSLNLWGMMVSEGNQMVAVCLFSTKFLTHHGAIDFLLVRRSKRNRGLGTFLLHKCMQLISSEKVSQVPSLAICTVDIDTADPEADEIVKWYTARGFDKTDVFERLGISHGLVKNAEGGKKRIWRLVSASNQSLVKNFALHCRACGLNFSNSHELDGAVLFFAKAATTAMSSVPDALLQDVAKELAQLSVVDTSGKRGG
jgi:ribosomal protein S18 acetylase RimI-like enzyme